MSDTQNTLATNDADQVKSVAIRGNAIEMKALEYAEKVSADTEADLADYAADKESVARGPIVAATDLLEDFGEALLDFPEPGSKEGSTGNRLPDKFTREITVDGVKKKKPASFYTILFDGTKQGLALQRQVEAIDAKINGTAKPSDCSDDFWNKLKDLSSDELKQEKARVKQSRTNRRNVMVKGVRLALHLAAVNRMQKVGAKIAMDKVNGEDILRNTPMPIIVYDKPFTVDSKTTLCSVDTFLSYDVEKAIAAGGTRGDLVNTASRDGSGGKAGAQTKGTTKVPAIENRNTLYDFIANLSAYLIKDEGKAELLRLAADKDLGHATRMGLVMIYDRIDSVAEKSRHEYEVELEKEALATKAKANAN